MTKRLSKRFSMEKKSELSLEKLIELIKTPSFNKTSSDLLIMRNYLCKKIDYFKKLIQEPNGKDERGPTGLHVARNIRNQCINRGND